MKQLFNDNWYFHKEPLETPMEVFFQATDWQPVDIPHDWMIYNSENLYEEAVSCYKKTFRTEELGTDRLSLLFEGVYRDTTVFLNGEKIFQWKCGYSRFEVDLTGKVHAGENTVWVRNVYRCPNSRWYPGSGIYRNVWLVRRPAVHFTTGGLYLSTAAQDKTHWTLFADCEVYSHRSAAAKVSVRHTVLDPSGKEVCTQISAFSAAPGLNTDKHQMAFSSPLLWDIETPNLYRLRTELLLDGAPVDTEEQNFGFRTTRFDPDKGLFLNGRSLKINGSCEHQTLGALGAAMNKTALRRQLQTLKEMGVNSIRSAHNMPSEEMLDLCDEMGLLLYSESFDMWESCKTQYDYGNDFAAWWQKDITSWVRQDRSHPCVFIWNIGNEIGDTHHPRGLEITVMLRDAVRKLDYRKNAAIAIASNLMEWEGAQNCADAVDLAGYNYLDSLYQKHHQEHPDWCIFGSETSSTVQSRGIYHFPLSKRLLTYDDMQCSTLGNCTTNWGAKNTDHTIAVHRDCAFCFGQYIWSGWDYIGEPTPYFSKNSFFGQIDTAGFPKDTYYHYQAEWTDCKTHPMVHLLPYWDFNEGQMIDVRIYSNAPRVELFWNGVSQGAQNIDHTHGTELEGNWRLPYHKGTLKAIAYDKDGNPIAEDVQSSFGDPVRVALQANKPQLAADGTDLLFVEINTLDENGTFVANSRSRIHVTVSGAGRLIGLDNGDSTDYESYKGTSRRLFSGRLLAIIAAKTEPGEIRITAASPSLEPAMLTVPAVPAPVPSGISCLLENTPSPIKEDIPVRKIELLNLGVSHLDAAHPQTTVTAKILPENATYREISFRARTLDGVDSNSVKIEARGTTAVLTAAGDGAFRLCAACCNDKDHPEIISELEFDVSGLGQATFDAYKLVSGINNAACSSEAKLSFQGGVYITSNQRTSVVFENIDFGEYGSDEIHIPIFSFEDSLPVEVWLGSPDAGGERLLRAQYQAKSWYNHYQENVFSLSRRIKGVQTISIVVEPTIKMSLQGFYFTKLEKAFGKVDALENNRITGDQFQLGDDAVTEIGNNVTLEFEHMDFGEDGCASVTICGHSPIAQNIIHVRFYGEDGTEVKEIAEFSYSDEYEERTFPIHGFKGQGKVNFIFMPGSRFDFRWFRFNR
ncbi:DUF4982 domain-containing protein [Caproicibacterium sp. XB1]|uniref:DUF4982 domain-containing protein n=1 Tax=Caproicibacterium sp. XB1 TaxID=3396405 RepID=UPI0039B6F868